MSRRLAVSLPIAGAVLLQAAFAPPIRPSLHTRPSLLRETVHSCIENARNCADRGPSRYQAHAISGGISAVRSVALDPDGDRMAVRIEADGPLPFPRVGVLADPPRIYLDFAGVRRATSGTSGSADGMVRRVRVALNQEDPVVTRVVIDLSRPLSHRVDGRQRDAGRIRVVLGGGGVPEDVPAPAAVVPKPPPRRSAAATEARNAALVAAAGQLERLRPLLASIDARTDVPETSLRDAIAAFAAVRQMLTALRRSDTQDALVKVCVLGTTAAAARIEAQEHADSTRAWNAASAAAGALMMLDRASRPPR